MHVNTVHTAALAKMTKPAVVHPGKILPGKLLFSLSIYARIRAAWSCFGKNKEILQDKQLPISLKKQVMDQCILPTMTYGCQTWSLNKQMTNRLRTAQRAIKRKMLDLKLKDKITCSEIRKRTKIIDIIEYTLKQKWKWAGHIARLKDNRWTKLSQSGSQGEGRGREDDQAEDGKMT